jgi:hypothetical protein
MSTNRWIAASLIAVTAVLSVCLCAVLAAPVVNENAGVGTPARVGAWAGAAESGTFGSAPLNGLAVIVLQEICSASGSINRESPSLVTIQMKRLACNDEDHDAAAIQLNPKCRINHVFTKCVRMT